jgi:hypothetical protein
LNNTHSGANTHTHTSTNEIINKLGAQSTLLTLIHKENLLFTSISKELFHSFDLNNRKKATKFLNYNVGSIFIFEKT